MLSALRLRVLFLLLLFFQYEASRTVLHATMAFDRGSRQARKERIAVIKA